MHGKSHSITAAPISYKIEGNSNTNSLLKLRNYNIFTKNIFKKIAASSYVSPKNEFSSKVQMTKNTN